MRFASLLPLAFLAAVACEGDVGPTGPEGPQGPPNNANVVSGNFTVAADAWTNDFWYFTVGGGTQGNPAKVTTVNVPALTASLTNAGAVFVYLRIPAGFTGGTTHWSLLPFHQGGFGGGYLVSIKAAVQAGEIRLGYLHETTDAGSTPPSVYNANLSAYDFRWVAVASAPTASVVAAAARGPDALLDALKLERMY